VQTVLIYVVIPAGVYGVVAMLTLLPKAGRGPRYRSGQAWTYEPVWWSAKGVVDDGRADRSTTPVSTDTSVRTARGGARGNW
jgi:hypothetical protein